MKHKYTILISGATATGKSSFAVDLAQQISGEIINADIGSFYQPLVIGVAKPNWKNCDVPHHMFDVLKEPELYSIVKFRQHIYKLIQEIWQRGNVPIIVGGSAFYIQSFFYKQYDIPGTQKITKKLEQSSATSELLWQKLNIIDSVRAKAIDQQDRYRIIRALAIFEATQKKPSNFGQIFEPLSPYYFIVCQRDRSDLYDRINQRVLQMLDEGWLEETALLSKTKWEAFLLRKKMIGYDDLLQVVNKNKNLSEVIPLIQQKTRNYAKRQITFLKKLQKDLSEKAVSCEMIQKIEQIDLTLCDVGLYIKQLVLKISNMFG